MHDVLAGRRAWHVEVAHVLDGLAQLPDGCVQTVITSPPYWSLRAYGTEPVVMGGAAGCEHEFTDTPGAPVITGGLTPKQVTNAGSYMGGVPTAWGRDQPQWADTIAGKGRYQPAATCARCNAWRGELGSEPDPTRFVANLVAVMREVKRVLRADGTVWLNIGDSYAGSGKGMMTHGDPNHTSRLNGGKGVGPGEKVLRQAVPVFGDAGVPSKSLCLIPERLALALADDGWIIRSRIAWCKKSSMPESVTDRPTSAWEHVWLLAKQGRYFYDAEAVRQPSLDPTHGASEEWVSHRDGRHDGTKGAAPFQAYRPAYANLRNYWAIPDIIGHGEPQESLQDVRGLPDAPAPRCLLLPEGWDDAQLLSALRGSTGVAGSQGQHTSVHGLHAGVPADSSGATGDTALRGFPEGRSGASPQKPAAPDQETRHLNHVDCDGMASDSGAVRQPVRVLWSDGSITDYRPQNPNQPGRPSHEGERSSRVPPVQQSEEGQAPLAQWWLLGPSPFPGAHFATFPTEIPRRAILAGTSAQGACPQCGAPWRRVVNAVGGLVGEGSWVDHRLDASQGRHRSRSADGGDTPYRRETTGWSPTCRHPHTADQTVPCLILDPFAGAGTSLLVADRLGRRAIGIELNPDYARMAEARLRDDAPLLFEEAVDEDEAPAPAVDGALQLGLF